MSLFGDLNEVKILGNMTADPELRYTSNGTPVLNTSVATNRRYKAGDDWKEETEFHNIVLFGNLADAVSQRAHKGTRVMVQGRLRTSIWEDNTTGKKNYKTEVIADDLFLIDRYERGPMDNNGGGQQGAGNNAGGGSNSKPSPQKSGGDDVIDPDDLPF